MMEFVFGSFFYLVACVNPSSADLEFLYLRQLSLGSNPDISKNYKMGDH
jgi:hypothetical protein